MIIQAWMICAIGIISMKLLGIYTAKYLDEHERMKMDLQFRAYVVYAVTVTILWIILVL